MLRQSWGEKIGGNADWIFLESQLFRYNHWKRGYLSGLTGSLSCGNEKSYAQPPRPKCHGQMIGTLLVREH